MFITWQICFNSDYFQQSEENGFQDGMIFYCIRILAANIIY
jgi:hypothetical protein